MLHQNGRCKIILQEPTHEYIRAAWDLTSQMSNLEGLPEKIVDLQKIWKALCEPPDGYSEYTFTILLAGWLAYHQCSKVDLQAYADCRAKFNTQEWRDLVFCSIGFNPQHPSYNQEAKTWILARLLPLVESNYHIMELAPKGTGKSFVFENISSKVALISGGKVTPAQLFINGKTK